MPSRRSFLATTSILAAAATSGLAGTRSPELIHHVFFWLKNPDAENLKKLIEGIQTLEKIETIREFRIGTPAKTPKRDVIDDTYSISLMIRFKDVAGHDVYQEHPVHKKFVENCSSLWRTVRVYDAMDI